MGETTGIEWTHHTFNPWWGCTKVSPACDRCYAESTSNRYGFKIWGQDAERRFFGDKHWAEPLKWNAAAEKAGVRKRVFCASMADVMEDYPGLLPWRNKLSQTIFCTQSLDWLLLTKRPGNFVKLLPMFMKTMWGMTTVESQDYIGRVDELIAAPFRIRGLSVEPMLGPVKLGLDRTRAGLIHWVIVGTESGYGARPMNLDWARQLRDECQDAGIAFFVKQMLVNGKLTKDPGKFPQDLQIRQFPVAKSGLREQSA